MENIWNEQCTVRTWDVDRSGRMHPAAVCNFFQEIAGNHAVALGVGKDDLIAGGHAWILSRMTAVVDSRPQWGDTLIAKTWPRGIDRLFAIRDYELTGTDGTVFARGRSAWVVIDTAKMRPVRPNFLTDRIPLNEGRDAVSDGIPSLASEPALVRAGERSPAYSDIDYNGHVNNARYVQWIQDILPPEPLEAAAAFRLDINYLSEVRPGMSVALYTAECQPDDGAGSARVFAVEGRPADGQAAFRSHLRLLR